MSETLSSLNRDQLTKHGVLGHFLNGRFTGQ